MAFLGKLYTCYKSENMDVFLKQFAGVPDDKAQLFIAAPSSQKFEKNGDTYTHSAIVPEGPKVFTFKSGVEFDDVMGPNKEPIKNTFTVDGNVVTQTINADVKKATIKREFNGDELVITLTTAGWDGVAKRYYKV